MNQYYKNNPDIFKECMRDMLRFLYTIEYSKRATISETAAENYFKKVLEPICKFISLTSGRQFTIEQQQPIIVNVADFIGTIQNEDTRCIRPDLVIYEGKHARIVIEMKAPPLFIGFKIPKFYEMTSSLLEVIEEEDDFSVSDGQRLHKVLKQLLIYMIGLKCLRGMVSDGYSVILVEIDILKLEKEDKKNQVNQIPLKLTTFDCKSSNPSYIQGILYFLMKAVLEPSNLGDKLLHFKVALQTREEVIRGNVIVIGGKKSNADNRQNKGRPTNYQTSKGSKSYNVDEPSSYSSHPCVLQTPPTSAESDDQSIINPLISSLFISWEDKPTVLQNAFDYLSHVVKIKAKFVKSYILEDINDEDDVVVKIFDPKLTKIEKLDRVDIIENVNTFYRSEKRSAEVLTSMDVDTLYLKQIYGNAIYNYGYGPLIMGKFIVSKYVASEKFPITTEVFNMAREQLSKIHEVGIAHGDIRESNILFNKEYNKVYLIDFGHAVIKDRIEDSNDVNYGFNDEKAADRAYLAEVFLDANE